MDKEKSWESIYEEMLKAIKENKLHERLVPAEDAIKEIFPVVQINEKSKEKMRIL